MPRKGAFPRQKNGAILALNESLIENKIMSQATSQNLLDRITSDPAKCGGKPCIRGMRIRVADVLEMLAANLPPEQILADFPDLEAEDIQACLQFAAQRASHARLVA